MMSNRRIDAEEELVRMMDVGREDRALLRSNPSARLMPGHRQALRPQRSACLPSTCSGPQSEKPTWPGGRTPNAATRAR